MTQPRLEIPELPVQHARDVIIVDHDDVSALLLQEVLTAAGYATAVKNLSEFCEDLQLASLLVLADPSVRGPADEVILELRRLPGGAHASIIVITPAQDSSTLARLLDAGADAVLTRPWSPLLLRASVAAQLRRHHQEWHLSREKGSENA